MGYLVNNFRDVPTPEMTTYIVTQSFCKENRLTFYMKFRNKYSTENSNFKKILVKFSTFEIVNNEYITIIISTYNYAPFQ